MWHVLELNALRQMKSQMCYMENNKEQIEKTKKTKIKTISTHSECEFTVFSLACAARPAGSPLAM